MEFTIRNSATSHMLQARRLVVAFNTSFVRSINGFNFMCYWQVPREAQKETLTEFNTSRRISKLMAFPQSSETTMKLFKFIFVDST